MYYRIYLRNKSNISYDISSLRFYIEDRKAVKRTASQQIEITPLRSIGNETGRVEAQSECEVVFAVPKFTIPDAQKLNVELYEKNGGRHLRLFISNRRIVNAKAV